jgi:hypothetical protein
MVVVLSLLGDSVAGAFEAGATPDRAGCSSVFGLFHIAGRLLLGLLHSIVLLRHKYVVNRKVRRVEPLEVLPKIITFRSGTSPLRFALA